MQDSHQPSQHILPYRGRVTLAVEHICGEIQTGKSPSIPFICGTLKLRLTLQQVEDTLNNSNELFLTFRKEMEEMSKKTKVLERENQRLTKKHDALKNNILKMAEERDRHLKDIEKYKQADKKMRDIIKTMQEQGRGGPVQEMIDDGTESEYDEYDDDEEEDESYIEGDPEDDTLSTDVQPPNNGKAYAPPEPPPKLAQQQPNGTKAATVNGLKH